MRLIFLALDVDLSASSGDSIHVRSLSQSLARLGHSVHVVSNDGIVSAHDGNPCFLQRPTGGSVALVRYVCRLARQTKAEVIYERRVSPKISATAAKLLRIPYAVEVNGLPEVEARMLGRAALRPDPVASMKLRARGRALRSAAATITVTPGLRKAMIQNYGLSPDRVFVVPNGVDPGLFRPTDGPEIAMHREPSESSIVCFVGNLAPWQGVDLLIDAIRLSGMSLQCVIVGDGPDRTRLVAKAKAANVDTQMKFVGAVAHSDVPSYVRKADVCVAPFTSERNLSIGVSALKVLEYIACGKPVVVTAIPGAEDLIRELRCGIVVPPGDAAALAQALGTVVRNPRYLQAAFLASNIVRERYTWDQTAGHIAQILGAICGETL